jgi:flavin-dependent dehydrogenase
VPAFPDCEIAIVGGGPAGLAVAIHAARAGRKVIVLERASGVPDKACGEGLMPQGLRALEALGVRDNISGEQQSPFLGIRYWLEDGRSVEARFRNGTGLGVRRTALSQALREAALKSGAVIERATVRGSKLVAGSIIAETDRGELRARLLVGADGLQSPLRKAAQLDAPNPEHEERRYGLRRHFARAPWSDLVEVHWIDGGECYVTPTGATQVNVAFLWEPGSPAFASAKVLTDDSESHDRFATLLARFPLVKEKLGDAMSSSESRGSGPLFRPALGRAADRIALVGDAAGYVDAITGQGLSLAFLGAEKLVRALPEKLDGDGAALNEALRNYDRSLRSAWRGYALPARALLALARRPKLRRAALGAAVRFPKIFARIVDSIGK